MTGVELGLGILIGVGILLLGVFIVAVVATKISSKEINNTRNIYLGKLTNSDSPIQNAMKYLELTNGIKQQMSGEKK